MATTAGIFEASTVGSFMLPGMSSPEQASCSRVVRFDSECVLIPKTSSRSKMPVVLTKSYSLPLWKRKPNHFLDSDEDVAGSSVQPQSPEDNRVTIKVPIPTFRRRTSRSPTPRARSVSSSPTVTKSPPSCLVYRSPSVLTSSPTKPLSPIRRPSLPIYQRRQDELTIPLRDCCADCQRITEECLKEGDDWKEKFSRGARRRRSASLEFNDSTSSHTRNANLNRAFTPFSTEDSINKDLTSRFTTTTAAAFSITVDEVDRRRKSFDYNMEDTDFIRTLSPPSDTPPSPSSSQLFHSSASPFSSPPGSSRYPRMKPRDRETSSSSTVSSASTTDEMLPVPDILDSRNRLRSSPIEEEDETQLFPLPRRSRSNTPSPSPSPKISPASSPNGSTSSLPVKIPPHLSPGMSKQNSGSSQESILGNSLSRKAGNGHLAAPTVSMARSLAISSSSTISSSPPPSPQSKYMRGPISGLNIPKTPAVGERVAMSPASPKGPRPFRSPMASEVLSRYEGADGENNPSSEIQVPSTTSSSATTPNEISDQHIGPLLVPPTPNSPPSTDTTPKNNTLLPSFKPAKLKIDPTLLEPPTTTTTTTTKSLSPSSPSSSQTQTSIVRTPSQQRRKLSFTLPFIKAGGAIRDVGVDVLKGVSSISSSPYA